MLTRNERTRLLRALDLVVEEHKCRMTSGLHFEIVHRNRLPGTNCAPGEEILALMLQVGCESVQILLSPAMLLLADYLLRNSRFAQSAAQIARGIQADAFYVEHGRNGHGRRQTLRRIPRSAIRIYISRLHQALDRAFGEMHLYFDPRTVLVVHETTSNHVVYRWKGVVSVTHQDLTKRDLSPLA